MISKLQLRPHFNASQQLVRLGKDIVVGGIPGDNPVLLVGSLFYHGDKLLIDEDKGIVDKEAARKQLMNAKDSAENYGARFAVDLILPSLESVDNIMTFAASIEDLVLFIDSPDPDARIKAYGLARELGITERTIANGLYTNTGPRELEAIRESGIKTAILLAFDPANPHQSMMPNDRLRVLEEKLLPLARKAGIENILVDAVVLDPASIGISAATIRLVKDKYGFPSGCAPANALGPVSKTKFKIEEVAGIHGGTAVFLRLMGADFIMYGPVKRIKYVAPAVAFADGLLGYLARYEGVRIDRNHPLRKILKNVQKMFTSSS